MFDENRYYASKDREPSIRLSEDTRILHTEAIICDHVLAIKPLPEPGIEGLPFCDGLLSLNDTVSDEFGMSQVEAYLRALHLNHSISEQARLGSRDSEGFFETLTSFLLTVGWNLALV